MPLDFLKRRGGEGTAATAVETPERLALPEEVTAQEHSLKLSYTAKTTEGVRMKAGPQAVRELPEMLAGLAKSGIEVIEPLPIELQEASPVIQRPDEAVQWLHAHGRRSPIARHTLVVLESVDAIDLAFDTFAVSLLHGEVDTGGYPEYNAIVGGVASHWDEVTGDMIVRAVVGWGGRESVATPTGPDKRSLPDCCETSSPASTRSASRPWSGRCRRPGAADSFAPTARSPLPTSGRSTARSAACGCFAARPRPHSAFRAGSSVLGPLGLRLDFRAHMPIYEYACTGCGRRLEVIHGIHETGPSECDACGGVMTKLLSPPAIVFRGTGWAKKERVRSRAGDSDGRAEEKPAGQAREQGPAGAGAGSGGGGEQGTSASGAGEGGGTAGTSTSGGRGKSADSGGGGSSSER